MTLVTVILEPALSIGAAIETVVVIPSEEFCVRVDRVFVVGRFCGDARSGVDALMSERAIIIYSII